MTGPMTVAAPTPAHVVRVVSDGDEYLADCSCGWSSEWFFTPDDADRAGIQHRDGEATAADEMDLLMSALLDIQDDLSTVVVWLAEHWSIHLPALEWSPSGDACSRNAPAIRVLGYAGSPKEFVAAAHVLDVPVAGSSRNQHAIRDFGRVQIDVSGSPSKAPGP